MKKYNIIKIIALIARYCAVKPHFVFCYYMVLFALGAALSPTTVAENNNLTDENVPIIRVWNYYMAAPFYIDENTGLAFDIIDQFNRRLKNHYHFDLVNIPRARLNKELEEGGQGIVLFANWLWMGKNAKEKYLWTPALVHDHNVVITLRDLQINYSGPDSLKGLRFGAIRGRKYYSLESMFSNKEISVLHLNREEQALKMLLTNRIDVTSQPASLARYLLKSMSAENEIILSKKPLFSFNRHVMLTSGLSDVHGPISTVIQDLNNDPSWRKTLKELGFID